MSSEKLKPLQAGDPGRIGQYRLLARLGAGGMGRVYLGRSRGGRPVAVKVIHPHLAEDPQFRRRFEQEIVAARRVGGIHTVHVVDADTGAEPPWLVTEYIAGPSLHEAVGAHGALSEGALAGLGAGLAEGLMAIHDRNVVHRDLKPGNVLLAQDGPRIIDFGIARALDATSQTTSVVGTPGFMSPEQLRGREVGSASDLFCLAAVLAFAATGRRPFGDGPIEALGYRVVNEDPDLTGVPESLRPLIAAGLAKDPGDRPDLGAFLDRCSALVRDGAPPLPEPVTTMIATRVAETERLVPPPRHAPPVPATGRPGRALAAAAAAVAGVLLIAFVVWAIADGGDEPRASGGETTSPPVSTAPTTPRTSSTESARSTPSADPTRKAFEKISAGDCLNAYQTPWKSDEWSKAMPTAVGCGRTDAYIKVTKVAKEASDCSGTSPGDLDGSLWWEHGEEGNTITLCVERRLRTGDCFLGREGPKEDTVAISNGDLMTSWTCGKRPPEGYDYVLRITAFTAGGCPSGGRRVDWSMRGRTLCVRIV
ncbi:serine/threonine protein kinase [Spirillospora sp. NBC_00431]